MSRTTFTIPAIFALGLAGCDVQSETITFHDPQGSSPIHTIITNLDVGDIDVQPVSANAAVFAIATAKWSAERPTVTFRPQGDALYVLAECPDLDEDDPYCRIDFNLNVPRDIALEIHGQDTDIAINGLDGLASLSTVVGDIEVDDMAGPLALKAVDGSIHGAALTGDFVTATTSDGPITLEFLRGAKTVAALADKGSIRMLVPPTNYRLDVSTNEGEIDIGVSENPASDRRITAHTGVGDISIQPQASYLGTPVDLSQGQTARFADAPLQLKFNSIVEDSRCPIGLLCVWAGRVVASMTLIPDDGNPEDFELTLDEPAAVLGYSVQLTDVRPVPTKDEPNPKPDDYVLTLAIDEV